MQNSAAECRISYWVYVSGNANGASLLTKLDHYDQETILDFFPTTVDGEENSDQGWLFTEVVIGRHTGTFSVREKSKIPNMYMYQMHVRSSTYYRVILVVSELGWVDLDLRCSTILLGQ